MNKEFIYRELLNILDEESIKTLKLKFGENFDKLYKVDNKVNDEINVRICRLIRRKFALLENGEFVKITDYVNLNLDTIKERMSLLSKKEQERIYSLFGENLDKEVAINVEQKNSLLRKKSIERLKSGKPKLVHTNFKPLFDILSKGVFEKDEDALAAHQNIFTCDLLIIDDLGTELSNSFTTSQRFLCLNERILRKKSTIISTNLGMNQIADIYSERVLSRISSNYTLLKLFGADIRILKRRR